MSPGIKTAMNNRRGVEYGSPHVSMPMKGDISKIDALVQHKNATASSVDGGSGEHVESEKESRDMCGSPDRNHFKTESDDNAGHSEGFQHNPLSPMHRTNPLKATPIFGALPQSQNVFREPHAPTSWSNIVSSNSPPSPHKMTARSTSGETLLTSNMSQPPTNLQHLGPARSHSFEPETPPRHLPKSFSFGGSTDTHINNCQQTSLGIPPSHPGNSSYKESTLPALSQGPMPSSPRMYPSTPYHEFKPRNASMGSYSPISLGDSSMHSMTTDQTSPMSSPSLSPHVSPAMNSRKQHGDGPPSWHLSDSVADYHSELSSTHNHHHHHHHHRLHSQLPQSIPEHHRHEPDDPAQYGHHHSYICTSPPRHGSLHHPTYTRRIGPKPYGIASSMSHTAPHHRSSTEVLKTLLRKKACLYEPETSLAVALVTWLVGRRLALSQGYFTRQQLQAGVHSCVAGKIREGHVTRTKVNRCMQVILNSCFHYIIPRPDGSEECGDAFRLVFAREVANEDHLLGTLPPPWNNLDLRHVADGESQSYLFHDSDDDHHASSSGKPPSKESSAASQAGDSLDSGKRSVLLCYNENIRSAFDVFRCHNEFIRDVAHSGSLNLSPEDWLAFFSGSNGYRKRGANSDSFRSGHFHLADMHDRMDRPGIARFRTSWCAKRYDHDHSFCAFAHVDVNRGWLRRDPFIYSYKPTMCPFVKPLHDAKDCYVNACPLGVKCNHAHSKEEIIYHPESYKRQPCRMPIGSCPLQDICPNVHVETSTQQLHGYNRQLKRHYHDHTSHHRSSHTGPKRRVAASNGNAVGFGKLPDGSPMLYIDPAPLSEFEKTLVLPGLQAIFRDHSSSIFSSTMSKSAPREYGPFGYRRAGQESTAQSSSIPIGHPT